MADPREEPPWPESGFTKKMYSEWLDEIWQWLRDHRVVSVRGGFITDAPGGGLEIHPDGSLSTGDTAPGPWSPVVGIEDDTPTKKKVAIEPFASIMGDADDCTATLGYTGSGSEFSMSPGKVMYLEMSFTDGGAMSTIELKAGDKWTGYPKTIQKTGDGTLDSPYVLTKTQFLVAYGVSNLPVPPLREPGPLPEGIDVGDTRVVRCVFTPLFMEVVFREGFVFEYPTPWNLVSRVPA